MKDFIKKYKINISAAVLTVITASFVYILEILNVNLNALMGNILLVLISVILIFITFIVGRSVVKSLFFVGAEVSLVLFIAQSYCGIGVDHTVQSDSALKFLLGISFIYIIFEFIRCLLKEIGEHTKEMEEANKKKNHWLYSLLVYVFAFLFVYQLYLVINPILQSLCI